MCICSTYTYFIFSELNKTQMKAALQDNLSMEEPAVHVSNSLDR
jgi:hypothetical protein